MNDGRVRKVAALVLRGGPASPELLVFDHPLEEGGTMTQVPAGTIESGEHPAVAASRELVEETGVQAEMLDLVGVRDEEFDGQLQRRWVYLFSATNPTADAWPYDCDCGAPIRCYWVPFHSAVIVGNQQPWLDMAHEQFRVGGMETRQ